MVRTTRFPEIVRTRTFEPKVACTMLMGTLTCTSRPSRSKNRCGLTLYVMIRSPGGPPARPRSPWPDSRTLVPVSTPERTLREIFLC